MESNVADKTRSGSEGGLKPAISFGQFRVFFIQIFVTLSELDERPNFGIFTKKELAFSERESSLPCFVSFPNCCIRLYGQTGFSTTQCTHNVEILL